MASLKELSAKIIINNKLNRSNLPQDLKEYIHNLEFNYLLNKLKVEDTTGRDNFGFTFNNIICSLDHKLYIQYNITGYERWYERWNGEPIAGNVVYPNIKYINYYLRQENHFETKYPQKGEVKRCDYSGVCDNMCHCNGIKESVY